jgi:diguanylate cyclase (GGDEF)-like protein/PAS domain S-box-containing protein
VPGVTDPRRRRALIADDDPVVRVLAARALDAMGFEVEEVEDGEAALAAVERSRPDLAILDVEMPKLGGFETCAELRRRPASRELPILIATGMTDAESIDRAFSVGASDFIRKPIDWQLLQHRVRFLMRANTAFQDLRMTLTELSESRTRLANAQRIARLGSWEWVPGSEDMRWSEELRDMLGCEEESGRPSLAKLLECVHRDDRSSVEKGLEETARESKPWTLDHRVRLENGEVRVVRHHAEVERSPDGTPERVFGTIQDITDRRRAEEQIHQLAYYDSLTALPNRRMLEESLAGVLERARAHGRPVAVLVLNLDRFKRVNDTLGYGGGDELLQGVAARLHQCIELGDVRPNVDGALPVARLGGDEFAIVLGEIRKSEEAAVVARRILEVMREPFSIGSTKLVMGSSIGVAVYPHDGEDAHTVLRNANTAMHHAKDSGRKVHRFFRASMNERASRNLGLEEGLRLAAERDEFLLYYQPIWDGGSDAISGIEVLVRWPSEEYGLVTPAEFIPLAEEAGYIESIGEWVLRATCQQGRKWLDEGFELPRLSVNVSSLQLREPQLFPLIDSILRETGFPAEYLGVEITESALLADEPSVSENLESLRALGVRVALDDFGTGFSSLSHLVRYPIDTLKIDQSFVREIGGEGQSGPVISAVVAMAHQLKLQVVAEGVETEEQELFLRREGCDALQGFRLARPMGPGSLCRLLRRR